MKLILRIFATSMGVLPFLYLSSTVDPNLASRFLVLTVASLIAVIAILVYSIRDDECLGFSVLLYGAFPLALGYVVVSALALTQAANLAEGIFDISRATLALVALGILSLAFVLDSSLPRFVARAHVFAGTGLAIIAIVQYFHLGFESIPGNHIPYATMANKNLLSSVLFLFLAGMVYNWRLSKGLEHWLSLASIGIVSYVLIISQTRTVWLAIVIAAAATAILTRYMTGPIRIKTVDILQLRSRLAIVCTVTIVLLLSVVSMQFYNTDRLISTEQSVLVNTDVSSLRLRLSLWEQSLRMFIEKPALGHGPGNWKLVAPRYGALQLSSSEEGETYFLRPHNDFLLVLVESGIVGGLLYISVFLVALRYGMKSIRTESDGKKRFLVSLMIFGITGFLVISFFSFPRERIIHSFIAASMIATLQSSYHDSIEKKMRVSRTSVITGLSLAITLLLFCGMVGYFRLKAETHLQLAITASSRRNWNEVISEIKRAESFFVQLDPATKPLAWYTGVAYFNLNSFDKAIESLRRAYQYNSNHPQVLNSLALCYETTGDHLSASELYKQSLEVCYRDETLMNLAAVLYNLGEYQESYSYLLRIEHPSQDPRYGLFLRRITDKLEEQTNSESTF